MVRVIMIVEMAGRPAAHLTESLEKHVSVLREIKDAEVHEIKVSEPREIKVDEKTKVKKGEEMFTAFAECDFEVPSFSRMSETMFDFMPSSVEVIEPSSVNLEISEATDLLNNISGRLHRYDEIAKIAGERLKQMGAQLKAMQAALVERDGEIARLKTKGNEKKVVKKAKKAAKKTKKKVTEKKK